MRIGVDGRSLASAAGRGVAHYTRALLAELSSAFRDDEWVVLVPGSGRVPGAPLDQGGMRLRRSRVPGRALHGAGVVGARPRLDRLVGGCDVVWAPAPAPIALSAGVPLVLTVHDLSFEHRPEDYSAYERAWHRLARPRELARRAARVVAVSEATRAQVVREWGLSEDAVRTIRSGPGREPSGDEAPPPWRTGGGFVLAVGALESRKRLDVLVEAHARAQARGLRARLVLAGDGPLRRDLEMTQAHVLGRIDDAELDDLYRGALAVACVSVEEGFGFTPLEGLRRGVPAVVADLAPFAETLDAGALRVAPGDPEALALALLRLEREEGLREQLVSAGGEALERLSWARAAEELHAVLTEAAG